MGVSQTRRIRQWEGDISVGEKWRQQYSESRKRSNNITYYYERHRYDEAVKEYEEYKEALKREVKEERKIDWNYRGEEELPGIE